MNTRIVFLLTALSAVEVLSSQYHGPTAIPELLHNGYLADTHEVAAAKSAHLATLAHQSHGHSHPGPAAHGDSRYHGPTAIPYVLHDGHIADTHEVAAAKAEHFAAVAKARVHSHEGNHNGVYDGEHHGASGHENIKYHGLIAIPYVLHDGHIADTHEVSAAKAEHFAAVAKARAHGGYGHSYSGAGAHHTPYHGHLARPVVLPSGYLADTHEVAAAKQQHLHTLHASHLDEHSHGY